MRYLVPQIETDSDYLAAVEFMRVSTIDVPYRDVIKRAISAPTNISVCTDIIGDDKSKFSRVAGYLYFDSTANKWQVDELWEAFQW